MTYSYQLFDLGVFYRISIVPTNVYYIDSIPTEISPEFVVFIAASAIFLSTFAAIFPAWQASRQKPVETIRYE
jgi:lipoprotein-releasing system permease protein